MTIRTILFHRVSGTFLGFFVGFILLSLSTYINGLDYGIWAGPTPVILGLTLSCIWFIRLHAFYESERIMLKYTIIHWQRVIWRTAIALFIATFIHLFGEGFTMRALWLIVTCAGYIGGLFWLLFDFLLNRDRGKELFYVSRWYTDSGMTAWLDRKFSKNPVWWLVSKVVVFLISFWLYLMVFLG